MVKVLLIAGLCAGSLACTGRELLPTLWLRGSALTTRGTETPGQRVGRDFALTLHLTFGNPRRTLRAPLELRDALQPMAAEDNLLCEASALCDWAAGAETATLAALGVGP